MQESQPKVAVFLGIETSCDETALALIHGTSCIAHKVLTQDHRISGGVIPQVAARQHLEHLYTMTKSLFKESAWEPKDLDGIAVTRGPGLIGGLLVGILFAKGLSLASKVPLWPVHHLEAHGLMVRFEHTVEFPYLLLLLSGGHCLLAIAHGVGHYTLLGQTYDDAAGECLDKIARALGGPYPGGQYIEALAQKGNPLGVALPVPLQREKSFNFSFSGLKTACLQWITNQKTLSQEQKQDLCASLQHAIARSLCQRLERALSHTGLKKVVVSGGVAANAFFRQRLQEACAHHDACIYSPSPAHCTDNGLMIAWAGYEAMHAGQAPDNAFCARPYWPLDALKLGSS